MGKDTEPSFAQIKKDFLTLNIKLLKAGLTLQELQTYYEKLQAKQQQKQLYTKSILIKRLLLVSVIVLLISIFISCNLYQRIINFALGVRCIVPNNYFVWEATRPISDCTYCLNLTKPIILNNVTREEFSKYAYTSKPVVVKNAATNWPAVKLFDFNFLKNIYDNTENAYDIVDESCQFLHFNSDFISLRDVFSMTEARAKNEPGEKPWYVGWGNCDQEVLEELRKYYSVLHFLPEDAEIASKEYIFMGYQLGATMHLDFIYRLMWQVQLKGVKTWYLAAPPECESLCTPITFFVEPGDAVLIDTRVWYHGTTIRNGDFSLSVQSEYG